MEGGRKRRRDWEKATVRLGAGETAKQRTQRMGTQGHRERLAEHKSQRYTRKANRQQAKPEENENTKRYNGQGGRHDCKRAGKRTKHKH